MTCNMSEELKADINNALNVPITPSNYPQRIRALLRPVTPRGDYPLGVRRSCKTAGMRDDLSKPYEAQISFGNKVYHLGRFATPLLAHRAYQLAKSLVIEEEVSWWFKHPWTSANFDNNVAAHLLAKAAMLRFHAAHGVETTSL